MDDNSVAEMVRPEQVFLQRCSRHDGAFSPDGEFLPLPSLDASPAMQLLRRLLLLRLNRAERLTKSLESLLGSVNE